MIVMGLRPKRNREPRPVQWIETRGRDGRKRMVRA
jgi:hypothetical protein